MGLFDLFNLGKDLYDGGKSIVSENNLRKNHPKDYQVFELIYRTINDTGISYDGKSFDGLPAFQSKTKGWSDDFATRLWVDPFSHTLESCYIPSWSHLQSSMSIAPLMNLIHTMWDIGRFIPYGTTTNFGIQFEQPGYRTSYPHSLFDISSIPCIIKNQVFLMETFCEVFHELINAYVTQSIDVARNLQISGRKAQEVIRHLQENKQKILAKISPDVKHRTREIIQQFITNAPDSTETEGYWNLPNHHPELIDWISINEYSQIIFSSTIQLNEDGDRYLEFLLPLNTLFACNGNFAFHPENHQFVYKSGVSLERGRELITRDLLDSMLKTHNWAANFLLVIKDIEQNNQGQNYFDAFKRVVAINHPNNTLEQISDLAQAYAFAFVMELRNM